MHIFLIQNTIIFLQNSFLKDAFTESLSFLCFLPCPKATMTFLLGD